MNSWHLFTATFNPRALVSQNCVTDEHSKAPHSYPSSLLIPLAPRAPCRKKTINWILQAYLRSFTGKHWCHRVIFFLVSLGTLSGLKSPKLWKRHVWVGMSGSCLRMHMCWRGQYCELNNLFIFNGIWRAKQVYLDSSWITLRGLLKRR